MSFRSEKMTVVAAGKAYDGFSKISVRAGLDQAVRDFGFETTEVPFARQPAFSFPPGTETQILAGDDLLIDGYVNSYRPEFDHKTHKVYVEGRSKGQDWVDSSAVHPTGSWQNMTPLQIAKEIGTGNIAISAEVPLETEEDWALYQGESRFATLERMLRHQRATQMGMNNGDIKITNASVAQRHSGALIEGHNIEHAAGQLTDMGRFQEILVKGQRRKGTGSSALRIREIYRDRGVRRLRQKVLIHEGDTTAAKAKKRALYEAERAQGFSVRASIMVPGFRDDDGELWQPNFLVLTESPTLKIFGDMLIERVTYSQDEKKSLTELHLVHPIAHGGSAGNVNETDPTWSEF